MTGGNSPIGYLKAYHTNLYLSADSSKVREALEEGKHKKKNNSNNTVMWSCWVKIGSISLEDTALLWFCVLRSEGVTGTARVMFSSSEGPAGTATATAALVRGVTHIAEANKRRTQAAAIWTECVIL